MNRWPNLRAMFTWWRLINVVRSRFSEALWRYRITSCALPGSRLATGSSANSTSGRWTRARAIPTRCCWPPLIRRAFFPASSRSPTVSSASKARSFSPRPWSWRTLRRNPTSWIPPDSAFEYADMSSIILCCWNIIATSGRGCLIGFPSMTTSPSVGSVSAHIHRSSVDLPDPETPRIATNSPAGTSKETLSSATVPPNCFVRPSTTIFVITLSPLCSCGVAGSQTSPRSTPIASAKSLTGS